MKVLESQNALLSNYEVYQHILDQRRNNKAQGRRIPANAFHIMNEVMTYLTTKPSPLEKQEEKHDYSPEVIPRLMERLREADLPGELTKGELLSILNLRPSSSALLSTAIEDMEERFTEEEQNRIVEIIGEVLGRPDPEEEEEEEEEEGGEGDGEAAADGAEGEMDGDAVPSVEK